MFVPEFSKWRHGGWYVENIRYPGGAIGCVGKDSEGNWRIACGPEHVIEGRYSTRTDAAYAELMYARLLWAAAGESTDKAVR